MNNGKEASDGAKLPSENIILSSNWRTISGSLCNCIVSRASADFVDMDETDMAALVTSDSVCQLVPDDPASSQQCVLSLDFQENLASTVVIICSCARIEVSVPNGAGYLFTTRGVEIDNFDDTLVSGHIVNLRTTPVNKLELKMSRGSKGPAFVFGMHAYVSEAPARRKPLDVASTMGDQPSPVDLLIPFNLLNRRIDSLKSDLLAAETRIKAHVDRELLRLRQDVMDRLDTLLSRLPERNLPVE